MEETGALFLGAAVPRFTAAVWLLAICLPSAFGKQFALSRTLRERAFLRTVEIVIDFCLVVISAGCRGIKQCFQQVRLNISDVRGRVAHTVQNILDVAGIQLQKTLPRQNRENLLGSDLNKVLLRSQYLQHEIHNFIKVIVRVLPNQIVILDISFYLFSVAIHHIHR